MKPLSSTFSRTIAVGLTAVGLSSCSLFKNGKYASQWEIQTDVPASLSSGQATVPEEGGFANNNKVQSNLSGLEMPQPEAAEMPDLPGETSESFMDVPRPDLAMLAPSDGQSRPEMLNLPGVGIASDLPSAAAGSPETAATLLDSPPPVITDEELAAAPGALPPVSPVTMPESIIQEDPLEGTREEAPQENLPGKTPVRTAAAPSIPLLYGKLDLAPFLPPAPEVPASPEKPAGQ